METTQWSVKTILETSGYYWKTCTLHTGVKLEIFTRIGKDEKSAQAISDELNGDVRGVATLLNALAAMGLLVKRGDLYKNSAEAFRLLSKDSPEYIGFIIMHHHHLVDSWNRMSEAVLSGKPCRVRSSHAGEKERESFLMGMFNLASGIAPGLAKQIDFSSKTRFLDFGGGPGTYAIHFCLANPRLKATVFDLPTTREFALKTIERFNLSGRVDFVDGSYLDGIIDLSQRYDVAWLSHVLHAEGPKGAEKIIENAVGALTPGGHLYIHEFILDDTLASPLAPALFSINMLVGTGEGRSYSQKAIASMMGKHGVTDIKRLEFTGPSGSGILYGVKR